MQDYLRNGNLMACPRFSPVLSMQALLELSLVYERKGGWLTFPLWRMFSKVTRQLNNERAVVFCFVSFSHITR